MRLFSSFDGDKKIGSSLLAPFEKPLQRWLATKIPAWLQTYHLTLLTIPWSLLVITSGYLAKTETSWLWLSSCVIVFQYLSDLVDGEVGRLRNTGLIKWGYYMDHFLDYVFLCSLLVSYFFVVPQRFIYEQFFLLCIFGSFMVNSFLAFAVTNKFQISYSGIGPTEVRIGFIVVNTLLICLGSTHMSQLLPFVLFLSFAGLCITVYRTQKSIWKMDREQKIRERVDEPVKVQEKDHMMLERLDSARSEFISLVSHQLLTPLTVLKWSQNKLAKGLRGSIDPSHLKLLEEAHAAASRMSHTIHTMLAISRIEAGAVHVELSDIKLGHTLQEFQAHFHEHCMKKEQQLIIDCPHSIIMRTDPSILREILNNLINNAIKYTPDGGTIRILGSKQENLIRIDVEDNGKGIPQNQQNRVFHKFFRADNVAKDDTEGTGLGLYLVRLLVEMLGGTISFTSEEGNGTVFTCLFPVS